VADVKHVMDDDACHRHDGTRQLKKSFFNMTKPLRNTAYFK
jgi:hypothetical protein